MSRVLVVESSPDEADSARLYLQSFGFPATDVATLADALEALSDPAIRLVVLDATMPDLDVAGAIATLREPGPLSVVVASPEPDERDRFVAMTGGADAAVARPYQMAELVATVASTLQQAAKLPGEPGALLVPLGGGVQLDRAAALVRSPSGSVDLAPAERDILLTLASRPGEVVSHEALAQSGSDGEPVDQGVDTHVANLRQKLRRHGAHFNVITAVDDVGFRLDIPALRRRA